MEKKKGGRGKGGEGGKEFAGGTFGGGLVVGPLPPLSSQSTLGHSYSYVGGPAWQTG